MIQIGKVFLKVKFYFSAGLLLIVISLAFPSTLIGKDNIVDSLINRMSVREKISQLFIVAFSADSQSKSTIEAEKLILNEGIGGVIIMESGLTEAVDMINHLQSISKIPLLVTIDGEWGPAMRIDSIPLFPKQMQLGALESDSLVYQMGRAIGMQTKRLGIHVNFAPVVDINSNPSNPVINTRSYGERKDIVAKYGLAYMKGMRDEGYRAQQTFSGHEIRCRFA